MKHFIDIADFNIKKLNLIIQKAKNIKKNPKKFLKNVDTVSRYLWENLKKLEYYYDEIIEVRGAGLLLGIKTKKNNVMISNILKKNKLLSVPAADNVIRLAPPLIINKKHVDKAVTIIDETFKKLS